MISDGANLCITYHLAALVGAEQVLRLGGLGRCRRRRILVDDEASARPIHRRALQSPGLEPLLLWWRSPHYHPLSLSRFRFLFLN
jgi:hypothetical protein